MRQNFDQYLTVMYHWIVLFLLTIRWATNAWLWCEMTASSQRMLPSCFMCASRLLSSTFPTFSIRFAVRSQVSTSCTRTCTFRLAAESILISGAYPCRGRTSTATRSNVRDVHFPLSTCSWTCLAALRSIQNTHSAHVRRSISRSRTARHRCPRKTCTPSASTCTLLCQPFSLRPPAWLHCRFCRRSATFTSCSSSPATILYRSRYSTKYK